MSSIKQNRAVSPLPDFRNFGVCLRVLLGVNLLALAAALAQGTSLLDWPARFVDMAAWVQPLLLFNLSFLALCSKILRTLPPWPSSVVVVLTAAGSSAAWLDFWRFMAPDDSGWPHVLRAALLGGFAASVMLFYFNLRHKAFSPALAEARLHALTARIRPHFLFNSLNAVLSLIRAEPKRAETALEELAELFRALMRDHREMLPLAEEIALCRQYLDLEKLRLGERLRVEWRMDDMPTDLKLPPLMLQPLLENAVYHGIEPLGGPGCISICFARRADRLHIHLSNPCAAPGAGTKGQRMALANIRERLSLYYDLEARLDTRESQMPDGRYEYQVHIDLPYRRMSA